MNKIQEAEKYIFKQLNPLEGLVYEARMLTNPLMKFDLKNLKLVLRLVKLYHRKRLKEETQSVHQEIFSSESNADFKAQIQQIFKS